MPSVFRIEKDCDGDRIGPFFGYRGIVAYMNDPDASTSDRDPFFDYDKYPPWPTMDSYEWSDINPMNDEDYVAGFADLQQALYWFPNTAGRKRMHDAGYRLVQYEVPAEDVTVASNQIAFNRTHAKLVKPVVFVTLTRKVKSHVPA